MSLIRSLIPVPIPRVLPRPSGERSDLRQLALIQLSDLKMKLTDSLAAGRSGGLAFALNQPRIVAECPSSEHLAQLAG